MGMLGTVGDGDSSAFVDVSVGSKTGDVEGGLVNIDIDALEGAGELGGGCPAKQNKPSRNGEIFSRGLLRR